jgi:hypothetical protein
VAKLTPTKNQALLVSNEHFVLVDYENRPIPSIAKLGLPNFRVLIFVGAQNKKLPTDLVLEVQDKKDHAQIVKVDLVGKNALDFCLTLRLGELVNAHPGATFHIIASDAGYDAVIKDLSSRKIRAFRSSAIDEMPCILTLLAEMKVAHSKEPPQPSATAIVTKVTASATLAKTKPTTVDERVKAMVTQLRAYPTKQPQKLKALVNAIHTKIGIKLPEKEAVAVKDAMLKRGYITLDGKNVDYHLPKKVARS